MIDSISPPPLSLAPVTHRQSSNGSLPVSSIYHIHDERHPVPSTSIAHPGFSPTAPPLLDSPDHIRDRLRQQAIRGHVMARNNPNALQEEENEEAHVPSRSGVIHVGKGHHLSVKSRRYGIHRKLKKMFRVGRRTTYKNLSEDNREEIERIIVSRAKSLPSTRKTFNRRDKIKMRRVAWKDYKRHKTGDDDDARGLTREDFKDAKDIFYNRID